MCKPRDIINGWRLTFVKRHEADIEEDIFSDAPKNVFEISSKIVVIVVISKMTAVAMKISAVMKSVRDLSIPN